VQFFHFFERTYASDNIPYDFHENDLPNGWVLCRVIDLYNFIDYRGATPVKTTSGIPFVTAKNVKDGYNDYSISEFISEESYEKRKNRGISRKGDILFTTEAPLGNVSLADLAEFSAGQRLKDPHDEPASVLLDRIRAERERMIRGGKIKRGKDESVIFRRDNSHYEIRDGIERCIDDEIPFDIPDNWAWTRLGTLCNFGDCENTESVKIAPDAWLLDLEDIEKDSGCLLQRKRKGGIKSLSTKHRFFKGQVLYSKLRPYLNKVIIADEDGYCTSEILPLDFGSTMYNRYAQVFLMCPYFVGYANQCSYGVKMPRLGTQDGRSALVPVPPDNEQRRIVAQIDAILLKIK